VKKLEISKNLSAPPESLDEPTAPPERPRSAAKSVHFDAAPAIIPDPEDLDEEEEPEQEVSQEYDPNAAVVLYDFTADGDDELTVAEGEDLILLDNESDDWWKVRNSDGQEGVVPASYVEVSSPVYPVCIMGTKSVSSCEIHLLLIQLASHRNQNSRLGKKLKPRLRPSKRGVGKKKKLKRPPRRSELGKLLSAPKPWLRPTRNVGTKRGPRGRKRERSKNKRGSWPLKGMKAGNHNRAYDPFIIILGTKIFR
jgi:hypothetical protein